LTLQRWKLESYLNGSVVRALNIFLYYFINKTFNIKL
jgi:hypothetical protein